MTAHIVRAISTRLLKIGVAATLLGVVASFVLSFAGTTAQATPLKPAASGHVASAEIQGAGLRVPAAAPPGTLPMVLGDIEGGGNPVNSICAESEQFTYLNDGFSTQDAGGSEAYDSEGIYDPQAGGGTQYLPVYRWTESSTYHSRLGTHFYNDISEKLQRNMMMLSITSIGNFFWNLSTSTVQLAMSFCLADRVGGMVDHLSSDLMKSLVITNERNGYSLVALLFIGTCIFYLFKMARGGAAMMGELFKRVAVFALVLFMMAAAANSTGADGTSSGDEYNPGLGSPGWFATTVDDAVSGLASGVVAGLPEKTVKGVEGEVDPLHCADYVWAMKKIYKTEYGNWLSSQAANVPLLLSSMWENTGLQAWKAAQFGRADSFDYSDRMYCRILEKNNQVSEATQVNIWQQLSPSLGDSAKESLEESLPSLALWGAADDNGQDDQAYIAWATCTLSNAGSRGDDGYGSVGKLVAKSQGDSGPFEIPAGLEVLHKGDEGDAESDCQDVFSGDDYKAPDGMNWDDGGGTVEEHSDELNPDAKRFLLNLHGASNSSGLVGSLVYALGGFLIFLVFGIFAMAVLYAKIASLVIVFMSMFVMLSMLLPGSDLGRLGQLVKKYIGLSVLAWGAQVVLAMLAAITKILMDVGGTALPGGSGGIMALLWAGVAPLLAMLTLHMIFKKMSIPSPMTAKGGSSWARMGGNMIGDAMKSYGRGAMMARGGGFGKNSPQSRAESASQPGGAGATGGSANEVQPKAAGEDAETSSDETTTGEGTGEGGASGEESAENPVEPKGDGEESQEAGEDSDGAVAAGLGGLAGSSVDPDGEGVDADNELDPKAPGEGSDEETDNELQPKGDEPQQELTDEEWAQTEEGAEELRKYATTQREAAEELASARKNAREKKLKDAADHFRAKPFSATGKGAWKAAKATGGAAVEIGKGIPNAIENTKRSLEATKQAVGSGLAAGMKVGKIAAAGTMLAAVPGLGAPVALAALGYGGYKAFTKVARPAGQAVQARQQKTRDERAAHLSSVRTAATKAAEDKSKKEQITAGGGAGGTVGGPLTDGPGTIVPAQQAGTPITSQTIGTGSHSADGAPEVWGEDFFDGDGWTDQADQAWADQQFYGTPSTTAGAPASVTETREFEPVTTQTTEIPVVVDVPIPVQGAPASAPASAPGAAPVSGPPSGSPVVQQPVQQPVQRQVVQPVINPVATPVQGAPQATSAAGPVAPAAQAPAQRPTHGSGAAAPSGPPRVETVVAPPVVRPDSGAGNGSGAAGAGAVAAAGTVAAGAAAAARPAVPKSAPAPIVPPVAVEARRTVQESARVAQATNRAHGNAVQSVQQQTRRIAGGELDATTVRQAREQVAGEVRRLQKQLQSDAADIIPMPSLDAEPGVPQEPQRGPRVGVRQAAEHTYHQQVVTEAVRTEDPALVASAAADLKASIRSATREAEKRAGEAGELGRMRRELEHAERLATGRARDELRGLIGEVKKLEVITQATHKQAQTAAQELRKVGERLPEVQQPEAPAQAAAEQRAADASWGETGGEVA